MKVYVVHKNKKVAEFLCSLLEEWGYDPLDLVSLIVSPTDRRWDTIVTVDICNYIKKMENDAPPVVLIDLSIRGSTWLSMALTAMVAQPAQIIFIAHRETDPIAINFHDRIYGNILPVLSEAEIFSSMEIFALKSLLHGAKKTIDIIEKAKKDYVTRLPNVEETDRLLEIIFRQNKQMSVIIIDIDNFKYLNDTCGHEAADEVLRWVGKRIRRAVRPQDLVGKYKKGDEFLVAISNFLPKEEIEKMTERIKAAVIRPIKVRRRKEPIIAEISAGYASKEKNKSLGSLKEDADKNMLQEKALKGHVIVI
ncbi:GGDEF domain-containing protein [Candidatus Giovannonibacteria bacterium]|nr:GGDEF domain-containing protein [Candidatus Giovannonibacteria bacterium]